MGEPGQGYEMRVEGCGGGKAGTEQPARQRTRASGSFQRFSPRHECGPLRLIVADWVAGQ